MILTNKNVHMHPLVIESANAVLTIWKFLEYMKAEQDLTDVKLTKRLCKERSNSKTKSCQVDQVQPEITDWALHDVCCGTWGTTLEGWLRGRVKDMPFVVPRVGTELANHYNDCYFRILDLFKYKYSKRRRTTFDHIYADLLN